MNSRTVMTAAVVAVALALAACGGGGGSSPPGDTGAGSGLSGSANEDVARLGDVLDDADTLLMTRSHTRSSLTAEGGATIEDSSAEGIICVGARCHAADGSTTTMANLLDTSGAMGLETIEANLGSRDGFVTVTTRGTLEVTETVSGHSVTALPEVTSWGFWDNHGFAVLALGAGSLEATIEGTAYTGDLSLARAFVAGDATGTNPPTGTGSATWRGIAEASPTGSFERLQGTATVTMADLSQPRVDVDIDLDEDGVNRPLRWAGMPLDDGRFAAGVAGNDYLSGAFHGPAHQEAWGVFDTTDYIGAFGARRTP